MKTIGLIGGLTWYSTIDYYRYINQAINKKLGGDEAAEIILYSVNYGEIKKFTLENNWAAIADIISDAAIKVQYAGSDIILLGANTMHHVFNDVERSVTVPLLHIADAVAEEIRSKKLKTIALLGTKYTMQFDFFKKRLAGFGIHTLIPDDTGTEIVNSAIYEELGKGIVLTETKEKFMAIINNLKQQGAEGVILGCTEIPLLIKQEDCDIPVFDTTLIHASSAAAFALS
ncbi:MAG TPA: aspartate/glutamate racemase family protein [Chitinophagaceae bacterium]|nr:aspartate/glutamate racemase family protein [Chitinophagaceae bacterium]